MSKMHGFQTSLLRQSHEALYIYYFIYSSQSPSEQSTIIIPISQMWKPKLRELNLPKDAQPTRGITRILKFALSDSGASFLITTLMCNVHKSCRPKKKDNMDVTLDPVI